MLGTDASNVMLYLSGSVDMVRTVLVVLSGHKLSVVPASDFERWHPQ